MTSVFNNEVPQLIFSADSGEKGAEALSGQGTGATLQSKLPERPYWPYLLAIVTVGGSAAARFALDPVLGSKAPCLLFVCGVTIAALLGGFRTGLIAALLSIPVCDYFFIEPRYTLFMNNATGDLVTLAVFLGIGIALSALIERLRQTREQLQRTALNLERSELRFRTLAATTPEMLFTATADGAIDYVSDRFVDYTGMAADILRTDWASALHPDDRLRVVEQWSKSVESGIEFAAIYRIRRADGEYRWFKAHAKSICDASGRITQWTGVCADIHEQKVLEQELLLRTQEVMASKEDFQMFAWRVCHDLNEPLRSIHVFTELLERREVQKT